MLKSIGAVAVGVVAGAIVIGMLEGVGHFVFPPPIEANPGDPAWLAANMDKIPIGAKLIEVAAWLLGSFAGAAAALLTGRRWAPVAWVVVATLFLFSLIPLMQIPHPAWMVAGALIAPLVGGYGAIKAMGGSYVRPGAPPSVS